MKKTIFKEKYPVFTLELTKDECIYASTLEIIDYFKTLIDSHPVATYIATFNHFAHTKKLGGEVMVGLLDLQNIVFCFGAEIPTTKVAAVRPRSIGVCEFDGYFVIEFMEAPNEKGHQFMESWALGLKKGD